MVIQTEGVCVMKTVVVGDIHGDFDKACTFLNMANDDTAVIFVGDFLDSWYNSVDDQVESLFAAVEAVERGKNVLICRANHEQSYLKDSARCSGWSSETQRLVDAYGLTRIEDVLQDWIWLDFDHAKPILITHAGVSALNFSHEDVTADHVDHWLEYSPTLYAAGAARGGTALVGGILWCDWWREFEPLKNIRQIVGHSNARPKGAYEGVVSNGENYNIDCLNRVPEYIEVDEEGHIEIKTLEESKDDYRD